MYLSTKREVAKNQYYKNNPRDKGCVFCAWDFEEIVEQYDYFVIVRNKFGYNIFEMCEVTDHLMVVPIKHVDTLENLSKPERLQFLDIIIKYEEQGYNVFFREPNNPVRTINHHHTHFIKLGRRLDNAIYRRDPYTLEYS